MADQHSTQSSKDAFREQHRIACEHANRLAAALRRAEAERDRYREALDKIKAESKSAFIRNIAEEVLNG